MKARRILALSMGLAVVVAAAVFGPLLHAEWKEHRAQEAARLAAEPNPVPVSNAQQSAIVRAVMATGYYADKGPPGMPMDRVEWLVPDRTRPMACAEQFAEGTYPRSCGTDFIVGDTHDNREFFDLAAPRRMRRELLLANRVETVLPDPGVERLRLVAASTLKGLDREATWKAFPSARGTLSFSRAVSWERGELALVFVDSDDTWAGEGRSFLLWRVGETWTVAHQFRHYRGH